MLRHSDRQTWKLIIRRRIQTICFVSMLIPFLLTFQWNLSWNLERHDVESLTYHFSSNQNCGVCLFAFGGGRGGWCVALSLFPLVSIHLPDHRMRGGGGSFQIWIVKSWMAGIWGETRKGIYIWGWICGKVEEYRSSREGLRLFKQGIDAFA